MVKSVKQESIEADLVTGDLLIGGGGGIDEVRATFGSPADYKKDDFTAMTERVKG